MLSAVVIGGIYPAIVQYFKVRPSEPIKESPYIQRNINATRQAYGLAGVQAAGRITPTSTPTSRPHGGRRASTVEPNVRLLDPVVVSGQLHEQSSRVRGYYNFADPLDVDRYTIDGAERDAVVAVRELDPTNDHAGEPAELGQPAHRLHPRLRIRRGRTATPSTADGTPIVLRAGRAADRAASRSRSRGSTSARTARSTRSSAQPGGGDPQELDYPDDSGAGGQANNTYAGKGGVAVGSLFRKTLLRR